MRAVVIFHDSDGHPLDFLLRKGFKHCFVCVLSKDFWIKLDYRGGRVQVDVIATDEFDVADYYSKKGCTVIKTKQRVSRPQKIDPFYGALMVANCVGLVKTVLSIDTFSWTPYSLYKELKKRG